MEITATRRYLRIAPRKVRVIADTLKGLPVEAAEGKLKMTVKSASVPLTKLLRSAVANAKENHKLENAKLLVKQVRVSEGPVLKRYKPRAYGRASLIRKRSSHVTLVLIEQEKPVSVPPSGTGKGTPAKKDASSSREKKKVEKAQKVEKTKGKR